MDGAIVSPKILGINYMGDALAHPPVRSDAGTQG